jgi:hypothetical protein
MPVAAKLLRMFPLLKDRGNALPIISATSCMDNGVPRLEDIPIINNHVIVKFGKKPKAAQSRGCSFCDVCGGTVNFIISFMSLVSNMDSD